MVMKAGETAPSAKPKRNRTVAKPAKLVGAARHMQTIPQTTLEVDRLHVSYDCEKGESNRYSNGFIHCETNKLGQM